MNSGSISRDELPADNLTWREQEVLILLADHRTNREIADHLHLAESTVKDYVGRILSKLYVKNRRQAVERAKAIGLLNGARDSLSRVSSNLPAETTPFVGRKDELLEIKCQLGETRLITLTGPGGIGKTRLALKVAEGVGEEFKDGVFFVSLARISFVDHLVQTIAEALKFPLATHEDPQHQLLRYLQKKQLLMVMDNFEHLLEGASIVSEILQTAPGVKILATSRERLLLHSETFFHIPGMDFPLRFDTGTTKKYDAITLFVQSANKVCPGFDPSDEDLGKIVNICQIVQGMPLAIELAAAWMQILTLDEISEELEKGLEILASEDRDAPERHRSIHAVFDYSWFMLHPNERRIFEHLSIFRGGFTREAAQKVSGASLQQLKGLVNKSFLSHDPVSGRFEIHELMRQYAQERLGKSPEAKVSAQEAHAAYYAEFMQERGQQLRNDKQLQALAELEADIENVRAAWRLYLVQRNASKMWKFIIGLWYLYWIRWWNFAGMTLFREAVSVLNSADDQESRSLSALAMAFQGYFMAWLELSDQGYQLAKEGTEILEQSDYPEALVLAYDSLVVNAYFLNRYADEIIASKKMVRIANELGDRWLIAFTLYAASLAAFIIEDYDEARQRAELNLKIYREIGDVISSTLPLIVLGHVALAEGEFEHAKNYYQRCLDISEEVRFHYAIQTSSKYLGKVAISMGRPSEAEHYLFQSLLISKEIGFVRDVINLFYEFARLHVARDRSEQAVELLAFILQHPASHQSRLMEGRIRDSAKELLSSLDNEMPHEVFTAAMQRGEELELEWILTDLMGSNPGS